MRYFLDRTTTLRRLKKIGTTDRSAYSATGTAYDISQQDMQPDKVNLYGGIIGKTYDLYSPDSSTPVNAGDEVVIANARYSIRAKEVIDFGGTPYIALVAVKED